MNLFCLVLLLSLPRRTSRKFLESFLSLKYVANNNVFWHLFPSPDLILSERHQTSAKPLLDSVMSLAMADAGHSHQLNIVFLFDGSLLKFDQGFS